MKCNKKYLLFFILSLSIGAFLRFYKLDWGEGYYFHPDEYHIVGAVNRLINFGAFANPDLFSYGSFTVYLIYITLQFFVQFSSNLPSIFTIGRGLSALFSTLTLVNIYLISRKVFKGKNFMPSVVVFTSAFLPGFIQQAHFLTPETFMTFWITLSAYFFIRYFEKHKIYNLIISAATLGIAGATKVSSFVVVPFFLIVLFFYKFRINNIFKRIQRILIFSTITVALFSIVFPYSLIDFKDFRSTTKYESSLAMGAINVFYTRSFEGTHPFVFQATKIYPYTIGEICLVFSLIGLLISLFLIFKKNEEEKINYLILVGVFLSFLVFNSMLYAKWTRFVYPTIPFLIVFAFIAIEQIANYSKSYRKLILIILTAVLTVPTAILGLMYFGIYQRSDVRLSATNWSINNLDDKSTILTETGNTLEVPLIKKSYKIIPFDFYNVDTNPQLYQELLTDIEKSNYFIIQSRRIYFNHNDKTKFPVVYNFYNKLLSGKLGFVEIKDFNSYPQFSLGKFNYTINDEVAEETWTVFDHPHIRVFQKVKPNSIQNYDQLLRQ